jgi:hypothetical protein
MEFRHLVQRETHERLAEYLAELFEDPVESDDEGHFYVRYGTTVLEISVDPYGPEEAIVHLTSYCVQGVEVSDELMRGLLQTNHERPLGAFSLVGSDIFYSYALLARSMQPRDLLRAISAVAEFADEFDDKIVAEHGGQTALERIRHIGGRHRRRAGRSS